jgi:enterochelin esterase-like enzyme
MQDCCSHGYPVISRATERYRRVLALPILFLLLIPLSVGQETAVPRSPAIDRLQHRISSGQKTAVDEFWMRLSIQHAPIIETDPTASNFSLVTFVWRGARDTNNVVVISPLTLVDFDEAIMQRLGNTDVWFQTYRMRNDARMTYRFAVNDSLVPFEKEKNLFGRMQSWKADPLNPVSFQVGGGIVASVLELPEASSDKWTHVSDTSAKGKLVEQEFHSETLKNHRPAWIYTPADFDPDKTYPLLVILDGESYTSLIPMPTILDNLIAAKAIPPVVAVLLGNGVGDARDHEMNCNRAWSDALVNEALPWLRLQHVKFADNITIVGDSLTALAASCAARDYPGTFHKVISQSGSYFRAPSGEEPEWLARHLAGEPAIPVEFYLEVGLLETAAIPSRDPSMLTANRHLRDVLRAKGNEVHYVEHFSGHEHVSWRATIAEALIALLNAH